MTAGIFSSRVSHRSAWALLLLFFMILGVVATLKGAHPGILPHGAYYWVLDYSQGFIKRGLAGEVFRWFFEDDLETLKYRPNLAFAFHHVALFGLELAAAAAGVRAVAQSRGVAMRAAAGCTFALLLTSPLFPTLAYTAGYADPWFLALAMAGAWCVVALSPWTAPVFVAVGMFLNEGSCFVMAPVLAFAIYLAERRSGRMAGQLAATAASVLFTGWVLQTMEAPERSYFGPRWNAIGLDDRLIDGLYQVQFSQTMGWAWAKVTASVSENPGFFWSALGAALLVGAVPVMLGWRILAGVGRAPDGANRLVTAIVFTVMTLAPLCSLALAWDFSRLLCWFLAGAWLNLVLLMRHVHRQPSAPPGTAPDRVFAFALSLVAGAGAVVFFFSPAFFFYYDHGHIVEGSLHRRWTAAMRPAVSKFVTSQRSMHHVNRSWTAMELSGGATHEGNVVEIPGAHGGGAALISPAFDLPPARYRVVWDVEVIDEGTPADAMQLTVESATGTQADSSVTPVSGRRLFAVDVELAGGENSRRVRFGLRMSRGIRARVHGMEILRDRDGVFVDY